MAAPPSSALALSFPSARPLAEKTNLASSRRATASPRLHKLKLDTTGPPTHSAPPSPTAPLISPLTFPPRSARSFSVHSTGLVARADPETSRAPLSPAAAGSPLPLAVQSRESGRLPSAIKEEEKRAAEAASGHTRRSTRVKRPTAKGSTLLSDLISREYRRNQPQGGRQDHRNRISGQLPRRGRPPTAVMDAYQNYTADEGIFAFGSSPAALADPSDEQQLGKSSTSNRSSPGIAQEQGQALEVYGMVPSQHYQAGPTGSTSGQEEQRNPPFPHDTRVQSGSPAIAPYSEGQGYVRALQSTSLHQQNLPPHHQARSEWQAGLGPPSRQTSFTFGPFPPTESARYGQQDPALLQPGQHHPQSGNFAKLAAPRPIKYLVPVFERDGQYFQHPSYPVEPIFEEPDWSSQAYSQGQYRYPAARELEPAPRPIRTVSFGGHQSGAPPGYTGQHRSTQFPKQEAVSPEPSLFSLDERHSDMQGEFHGTGYSLPPAYPGHSGFGQGLPTSYDMANGSRAPSGMVVEERHSGESTPTDLGEYEKERLANIRHNDQLMQSLGLHGPAPGSDAGSSQYSKPRLGGKRKMSYTNLKANPHERRKKNTSRQVSTGPARTSRRIASMAARTSYSNLAGDESDPSDSEDEYSSSREGQEDDDEWEGSERSRSRNPKQRRRSSNKHRTWGGGKTKPRQISYNDPTLRDLVDEHPELRDTYPLFYHSCTTDMLISNEAFPLIGSVPPTCGPVDKADYLKRFFHKGRRCIAQLDAFTARCEKKYDGPGARWSELDYAMKIAIRDIRRKGVERCENYKYTRRDLLNRALGKNNWEPIEDGWVSWSARSHSNDPAGDLQNVRLQSPPPKPRHPAAPRPDPLMEGLQQPFYPDAARGRKARKSKANGSATAGQRPPTESSNQSLHIIHYQPAPEYSDDNMQEDEDSADEVDEEEARLEEERQQRLAWQQSQQQYTGPHGIAGPQALATGTHQSFAMYSAVRGDGADDASTIASTDYPGQNVHTPIPISRNTTENYQLGVSFQNAPASSQSTYSHPLSSAQSHHGMVSQMMSGGMDAGFSLQPPAHENGLPDAPVHFQPQQMFQVGLGPVYTSTYTPDQAVDGGAVTQQQQGAYAGVQGTQWTGPM